jgi:hypothetical protein
MSEFVTLIGRAPARPSGASAWLPTCIRLPPMTSQRRMLADVDCSSSTARSPSGSPPGGWAPMIRLVTNSEEPVARRMLHAPQAPWAIALRSGSGSGRFAMPTACPRG